MLAWTHQALASEGEVLRGLFFSDAAGGDGEAALLAAVVEGLGEPLAARLRSAVAALGGDVARVHGVARLLAFYAATFRGRLGGDALPAAVAAVADEARTAAEAGAKALGDEVRASDVRRFGPRGDAAAPAAAALRAAGAVLRADAARPDGGDGGDSAGTLLALVLDPVLQAVDAALDAAPLREFAGPATGAAADAVGAEPRGGAPGSAADAAAWAVDAFGSCAAELERLPRGDVVDAYAARFARRAAAAGAALAREAASALLRRCGLGPALARAREARLLGAGAASQLGAARDAPGLGADALGAALRSFYSSLFANPAPDVDAVHDEQRRAAARAAVAAILADAHAAVHALVDDDALGGYAAKADFLVHSPQQVRVLLDVEG